MTGLGPGPEAEISRRLARLTLAEKILLLTGDGRWTTRAIPGVGLRQIVFSDGPAGVQGTDPRSPSTSFPAPTALAATWDLDLVGCAGEVFAQEARRKGVDVVLAPVLNLQRTPVGGRHFENFSEDPVLTAGVGARFISAMQARGVGACAKHFVANDSETDRTTYTARVSAAALREAYLVPFERAVTRAAAWTVMAAYNGVDDGSGPAAMTEHTGLLTDVLKAEWCFDGVVVSDWEATRSTVASAMAGLDLVMPGPGGPWGSRLEAAVRAGSVPEATIDDKVRRLLRLAARVGKLDGVTAPRAGEGSCARHALPGDGRLPGDDHDPAHFARQLAARAMVVLRRGEAMPLPLFDQGEAALPRSIAVLGANARVPYVQGGGSAHVQALHEVSPLEGLEAALQGSAVVRWSRGGRTLTRAPLLDVDLTRDDAGATGVHVEAVDARGDVVRAQTLPSTDWTWTDGLPDDTVQVRLRTTVRLAGPGVHTLEVGSIGRYEVWIDGEREAGSENGTGVEAILDSSVNAPPGHPVRIPVTDEPRLVDLRADLHVVDAGGYGRLVSAVLRHRPPEEDPVEEIRAAADLAARSEVAIVVVGTNGEVESEGWDRADLRLPGHQDDLVRAVHAANPRTLVVVNAGAPVELPWLDDGLTVLWAWLPGQEFGHALADVLRGVVEPAGRLPWTLPASHADSPVPDARPHDGVVRYDEGAGVGYRGWSGERAAPAAPFGHGLGWSDWDYLSVELTEADDDLLAHVTVRNVGRRMSREVVQAYVSGPRAGGLRLAGFAVADAPPGRRVTVPVPMDRAALESWDVDGRRLRTVPGDYVVHVGRSLGDLRLSLPRRAGVREPTDERRPEGAPSEEGACTRTGGCRTVG